MRKLSAFVILILLISMISGCSQYREADILGKNAAQIQETYGTFDLVDASFVTTDSAYHGLGSGYLVKESRVGFLGTKPAEYFFIVFDKDGIAIDCYNGYHCNGG